MLGDKQSQAFIGFIADLRAAVFAAEVPSKPVSISFQDTLCMLNFKISRECILATSVGCIGKDYESEWPNAFRIRLEHIELDGRVII